MVPIALGVSVAVGAALYVLNKETELQRARAESAEMTTIAVREDLSEAEERGRELEAKLEKEYEASKMSRQQLGKKLAHAERQLRGTRVSLTTLRTRAQKLQADLQGAQGSLGSIQTELRETT